MKKTKTRGAKPKTTAKPFKFKPTTQEFNAREQCLISEAERFKTAIDRWKVLQEAGDQFTVDDVRTMRHFWEDGNACNRK